MQRLSIMLSTGALVAVNCVDATAAQFTAALSNLDEEIIPTHYTFISYEGHTVTIDLTKVIACLDMKADPNDSPEIPTTGQGFGHTH